MLYHQQFKDLTHVSHQSKLLWFPTPWFIPYPRYVISKNNGFNEGNFWWLKVWDVGDKMITLSLTQLLRRFLFKIAEFQLAFMMIVLYFWNRKAPLKRLDPLESAKNNPKISKFGLSGQNLRENKRISY